MEKRDRINGASATPASRHRSQQGFALISLTVTVPLIVTVLTCLAAVFMCLRRKSMAQSLCLQASVQLQNSLAPVLKGLLSLNRQAELLRKRRALADKAVKAAKPFEVGEPEIYAVAKAAQVAVILAQTALRVKQESWLHQAGELRATETRQLNEKILRLGGTSVHSIQYFPRALAVYPVPPQSLTPDYRPAHAFRLLQQQRYRFSLNLLPAAAFKLLHVGANQTSECSATLKQEGKKWNPKILAVSAPLN